MIPPLFRSQKRPISAMDYRCFIVFFTQYLHLTAAHSSPQIVILSYFIFLDPKLSRTDCKSFSDF